MKGVVNEFGKMKIELNPYVNPINKNPYLMNLLIIEREKY
jgi:hypothetical protein